MTRKVSATTTVFNESVLVRSGQGWKALTLGAGSLLSASSFVTGMMLIGGRQGAFGVYLLLLGTAIFACSFTFACATIRCPHCGDRWLWSAISHSDAAGWASVLFAQRVCPKCGR
jgi:hypothetical protein